jgi:predicted transcriptional regulator
VIFARVCYDLLHNQSLTNLGEMMEDKMPTKELINQTGMKKTQFAKEAEISYGHLLRCLAGDPISRAYAQRIVNVLNRHLKPSSPYTVENLNFQLSD